MAGSGWTPAAPSGPQTPLSAIAAARHPAIADFHIGALDGGPCNPAGRVFLTGVSSMGLEGVIESGPVDVLRVRRQMVRDRGRQILVGVIGHRRTSFSDSTGTRGGGACLRPAKGDHSQSARAPRFYIVRRHRVATEDGAQGGSPG